MWEKVLHGFGFEPATLGSVVQHSRLLTAAAESTENLY